MDPSVFRTAVSLTSIAVLVTAVLWWRARRFLSRGLHVDGTVTRVEAEKYEHASYCADHPAETRYGYRAHAAFTTAAGARVEFRSRVAQAQAPLYSEGQTVTVVYDPADPAGTAEIEGPAIWRNTIFAAIGTTLLLLFTVFGKACG